jgi:hypothetical protein
VVGWRNVPWGIMMRVEEKKINKNPRRPRASLKIPKIKMVPCGPFLYQFGDLSRGCRIPSYDP